MLFNSHPGSDVFKLAIKSKLDELSEVKVGDCDYGMDDYCLSDSMWFAGHFSDGYEGTDKSKQIYVCLFG